MVENRVAAAGEVRQSCIWRKFQPRSRPDDELVEERVTRQTDSQMTMMSWEPPEIWRFVDRGRH
jgi:hypothetical protein